MKERRKRNMSRTGLLFLFCLLMLCGCAQITGFMENTEVSGREVESLAAEKEDDTVLLGGMPVGIYMETDGVLVLDTEKMTGMDGKEYTPAQGVVSSGAVSYTHLMAFQIQDDILDVTSTTEQLGKPVHSDEKNEKTTYVTLKGIEQAHKDVERMTEEAIDELKKFPAGDNFLEQLLKSLVYREK